MGGTRRDFLRRVAQAGGYRATYLTMQAMGLLGAAAVAEPLALEPGTRHGTKVIVLGAGMAGLSAAYEVGAGVRWIRQDTEHPRMGQSTPEQFAIPGTAIRPTRKTKTQPLEVLDYGVRTALSFEQFEHRSNGALHFLVRIERNFVVVKNQTNRQREMQLTLMRF